VEGNVEPFVEIGARSARSGAETPPLGLAASPSGALCAVSPERGELFRIDLRTKSSTRLAAGLAHPSAAVALADGAIAVVEAAAGRLTRVETDGKLVAIASNLSSPVALAHHAGRFLVAEAGGGRIVALGAGHPPFPVASGFSTPVGVATDRTGRLVVADAATGGIYRVESDSSRTELATGLALRRVVAGQPIAVALAFDDAGALLVVAPGDGTLWRITPP
jgi:glucose/arabinose dehydrogenase